VSKKTGELVPISNFTYDFRGEKTHPTLYYAETRIREK